MKAAMARVTHKNFFVIFLGLLSAFSLGSSAWPYSVAQNQNCSGNCESHERSATLPHTKALDLRTASFTSVDGTSVLQVANVSDVGDVQAATPGGTLSLTDQESPAHKLIRTPQLKAEALPGLMSFFLLV